MDLLIAPNTVTAEDADKAPTTGTPGYATDGNPITGTPRTPFPAYAWNAIQIEFKTVIEQSGLTLNRSDNTQLYQAIQKIVAAGASEAAVGYTPVEQGGINGLTSDKINIGNGSGGLSAYIAGNYYGVLATQNWASSLFATQPALSAEAQSRSDADANLQNNINDRVWKGGDTMTGALTIEGNTAGVVVQYNPGSPATDTYINYPGLASIAEGRGGEFHCQLQEHVGYKFAGLLSLRGSSGTWRYMSISEGARINDSDYGDVAYTADLAGCVPAATYAADFATSDNRVINLPYGHRIQAFQASVGDGTTAGSWIPFPVAFSGTPVFYQANSNGNGDGATDTDYWCYGATAMGMYVRPRNHAGSANIIVIGPT
ncbi:hypothetical protein [Acetobacter malorum]|uniref:hypothetical protein n=1 Tax=Acetobacter malorum TaxID=178901 RepID=UPI00248F05F2|nr:hypothetical protein [Acetobacter malorum]